MRVQSTIWFTRGVMTFVHTLSFGTAAAYGVYHAPYQSPLIASLSLFSCIGIALSFRENLRTHSPGVYRWMFVGGLTAELVATSYLFGYRGLILVFPLTASFLYLLEYNQAIVLSLVAITSSLVAAWHIVEHPMLIRFGIALLLSSGFSAAFAYSLNRQKQALDAEANEDYLTGIASRRGFTLWLDTLVKSASKRLPLTLFYIDIDDFKRVNDAFGHAVGDELLKQFCIRTLNCLRAEDKVLLNGRCDNFSRLAGDEFALAVPNLTSEGDAERIAQRIVEQTTRPFALKDTETKIHVSIGILHANTEGVPADTLLIQADKAMYYAKQRGKNQFHFFDTKLADSIRERQRIELGLQKALKEDGFNLAFMPIYDCRTLGIVGAETLLRCPGPELAGIGPDQFIIVAEQQGLIREIDLMVLEKAFTRIAELLAHPELAHLWFAIHISALELHNRGFPGAVGGLLAKHGIPPYRVELEIAETSLVALDDACIQILQQLKILGVRLSLDDFGTGYTAFSQLMNYPIDKLKIDRSFVQRLESALPDERSMTDIVLAMADHYGLDVVAEGVETQYQYEYLLKRNCEYLQGYLFSKPVAWSEFLELAQRNDQMRRPATQRSNVVSLVSVQ